MDLETVAITYRSSKNEKTERIVDILGFDRAYFSGYCHLRNRKRQFRLNGVESCIEPATGEVIRDIFDFLLNKLRNYECRDPYETLAKLMLTENDFLLCLVYFGRLNGNLFTRKKVAVAKACSDLLGDKRFTAEHLDFLSSGFHFVMTTDEEFKTAAKNISRSNIRKKSILLEAVRQIYQMPKTKSEKDTDALRFIENILFSTQS